MFDPRDAVTTLTCGWLGPFPALVAVQCFLEDESDVMFCGDLYS